ncbi:MAG TPA: Uma2 family endonuclease [Kofleriaceae bacterium]|nr:Uma2 family endonuclease [Kofleriaceae bacterium]
MRAVVLEMPPHWLEERRRLGHDKRDEVWDGVLHMVPQPGTTHQGLEVELIYALKALVEARGYRLFVETSLFGAAGEKNYRVPDLSVVAPSDFSERGLEQHAEIVVELLSPNDESRDKLPFYAMCGVGEVWLIEPKTRTIEVLSLDDAYGSTRTESAVLGIRFSTVDGPKLRLDWQGGSAEV